MAQHFLKEFCRREEVAREFKQYSKDSVVAVGCPVSWNSAAAETLRDLLRTAGFPPAFTISEPVGAAFHFLSTRLRADAFHRDIVVFDWGAGTFDMTVLRSDRRALEGKDTWGSSHFGGRLFDDLFYQWFCDLARKQELTDELQKLEVPSTEGDIFQTSVCRKIKESFSVFYATRKPSDAWIYEGKTLVGRGDRRINLGDFELEGADEFFDRMRNYRASEPFRAWMKLDQGEPEEAGFIEALKRGDAVDLVSWATTLIEIGLARLEVGAEATALLTGGSCSWKWFQERVRAHSLFKGRELSVLSDSRPELTIARGLSRVYAVGSYSKRIVEEVKTRRASLADALTGIHAELLGQLSLWLRSVIKADDRLVDDIRLIFTDSIAEMRRQNEQSTVQTVWTTILRDRLADKVRPRLEQRLKKWISDNPAKLRRWNQQFAADAHHRIWQVLRDNIRSEISGLVEIAIEACDATGATPFDEALGSLGARARFDVTVLDRVFNQLKELWELYFPSNGAPPDAATAIAKQTDEAIDRLFTSLPEAIQKNISSVQSPRKWADQVIDHLITTLETLVRVARIDEANEVRNAAY